MHDEVSRTMVDFMQMKSFAEDPLVLTAGEGIRVVDVDGRALHRRPVGDVLRGPRPRERRARRGRRRPAPPAGDGRPDDGDQRSRPRAHRPAARAAAGPLLGGQAAVGRQRGDRERDEDRPPVPQADRQRGQVQDPVALPRATTARPATRSRPPAGRPGGRPTSRSPRRLRPPPHPRPVPPAVPAPPFEATPSRSRPPTCASSRRRSSWRIPGTIAALITEPVLMSAGVVIPPGRLPAGPARAVRPPRDPADLRRDHHRVRAARGDVRLRAVRHLGGHHLPRQGPLRRLRAAVGRRAVARGRRAVLGRAARSRPVPQRPHVWRQPGRLRDRLGSHPPDASATTSPATPVGRASGSWPACASSGRATRRSATSAAWGCSSASSSSATGRRASGSRPTLARRDARSATPPAGDGLLLRASHWMIVLAPPLTIDAAEVDEILELVVGAPLDERRSPTGPAVDRRGRADADDGPGHHARRSAGSRSSTLENAALRVTVLPELGGHVLELVDQAAGRDLLWHNPRTAPRPAPVRRPLRRLVVGRLGRDLPERRPRHAPRRAAAVHGRDVVRALARPSRPGRRRRGVHHGRRASATIAPARFERTPVAPGRRAGPARAATGSRTSTCGRCRSPGGSTRRSRSRRRTGSTCPAATMLVGVSSGPSMGIGRPDVSLAASCPDATALGGSRDMRRVRPPRRTPSSAATGRPTSPTGGSP